MDQLTKILTESNKRARDVQKGKYDRESIDLLQKEAKIQLGAVNSAISAYAIAWKNKRAIAGLNRMNLMDTNSAVDLVLGDPADDKLKCIAKGDELITRSECLDYSGSHTEDCRGCEQNAITKKILLD